MSDSQAFAVVVWAALTIVIWFATIPVAFEWDGFRTSPEGTRSAARAILWAPIWPLVLVYLLIRHIPPAIGRVFYLALGPKDE